MMEVKVRNWRIQFDKSPKELTKVTVAGLLIYEGKIIPRWGCGMRFIIDDNSVRYDYPEVVPSYVKDKLDVLRERIYM
jgi:hypothetical protein